MSLLEDVFLEDEAGEAERLERVIEGDEYEEVQNENVGNSDGDSEKEDEAQEDKRRVDPTKPKRVVKNPRFILNPARLTGPRGIQVIPEHFKDFKFKGKGHEKEDLDMVLKKLEHWAYRLYPKFEFSDCLKKIETLGKKRPVMVHLHKIRTDQYKSEEIVEQKDSSDDEAIQRPEEDEFDKLLQEQIDLARVTPVPPSVKKPVYATPMPDRSLSMPKATSSPSINEEQRERMLRNRRLAEERRLAKLNRSQDSSNMQVTAVADSNTKKDNENVTNESSPDIQMTQVTNTNKEVSKFNVNESPDTSDSECEMENTKQSIIVDIHDSENMSEKAANTDQVACNSIADQNTHNSDDVDNDIQLKDTVNYQYVEQNENSKSENVMDVLSNETTSDSKEKNDSIEINEKTNSIETELNIESHEIVNNTEKTQEDNGLNDTLLTKSDQLNKDTELDKEFAMNSKETHNNIDKSDNENRIKVSDDVLEISIHNNSIQTACNNEFNENEIMDIDFNDDF